MKFIIIQFQIGLQLYVYTKRNSPKLETHLELHDYVSYFVYKSWMMNKWMYETNVILYA